ncbi:hypothetical protein A3H11_04370 [Candidatus Uhrbacteria bacterium RIFCSPLOWO2_12_FULL_47_10]|nr:MAG: hypothetical protein A3H11_04370 [Candidatus Uhrbacteria bacterium RIFCSPLOWO2_12_FULL_47_10]
MRVKIRAGSSVAIKRGRACAGQTRPLYFLLIYGVHSMVHRGALEKDRSKPPSHSELAPSGYPISPAGQLASGSHLGLQR